MERELILEGESFLNRVQRMRAWVELLQGRSKLKRQLLAWVIYNGASEEQKPHLRVRY